MAKNSRDNKPDKFIFPSYFVFCEGATEVAYIHFLKNKYKVSIQTYISGTQISKKGIQKKINKNEFNAEKDKIFLLYDTDDKNTYEKLEDIEKEKPPKQEWYFLYSKPCIEFWFLLYTDIEIKKILERKTCKECNSSLNDKIPSYKKGTISNQLRSNLSNNECDAINKAKELCKNKNSNYSKIYQLIDIIKNTKKSPYKFTC